VDEGSRQPSSGPPRRGLGARLARALGRGQSREPEPAGAVPPDETASETPETEWLDAAVEEFERRVDAVLREAGAELQARVERDLAATEERLRESEERLRRNVEERLEGAVAEVRVQGDAQLADELERMGEAVETPLAAIERAEEEAIRAAEAAAGRAEASAAKAAGEIDVAAEKLGARARRQELKLVREENSKRIAGALARLERQAELRMAEVGAVRDEAQSLLVQVDDRLATAAGTIDELDRRLESAAHRLLATEGQAQGTEELVTGAVAQIEQALAGVEDSRRRIAAIEHLVEATARRIAELGEHAERAAEWEGRLSAATRSEAAAAERITEAERRLLGRIDPGTEQS
jgi:chromosome segregation ATPase